MKLTAKRVILKRFNYLRNALHNKHLKNEIISSPLYHYTNESGLKGILNSDQLYLTDFKSLNDDKEFTFFKDVVFEELRDVSYLKSSSKIEYFIRHFENYIDNIQLYTTSFCKSPNNIHLWDKYANKEHGYALGFKPDLFKFKKKADLTVNPDWPLVFLKVCYGSKPANNDIKFLTNIFIKLLETFGPNEYKKYAKFSFKFASAIFAAMPRYKSDSWEAEEEFRFFIMDKGKGRRIPIKGRPYIDKIISNYLCQVIIGSNACLNKSDIENLLVGKGYEASKIEITVQKK